MAGAPDQDAELMLRVKRGDREAFAGLVQRYQQPILSLAYRTLGDLAEAEDLTQQAFLQAWRSAHRYRDSARFSTWLYTIARNLCLNELRRRSRHPAQSLEAATAESEDRVPLQVEDRAPTGPTDVALQRELEEKIQEGLGALPPNQRMAVLLCREEDLSYEDIARILGCSVSATKSLIHRGRETLKHRLKPYLRTGAWDPPTPEREKL